MNSIIRSLNGNIPYNDTWQEYRRMVEKAISDLTKELCGAHPLFYYEGDLRPEITYHEETGQYVLDTAFNCTTITAEEDPRLLLNHLRAELCQVNGLDIELWYEEQEHKVNFSLKLTAGILRGELGDTLLDMQRGCVQREICGTNRVESNLELMKIDQQMAELRKQQEALIKQRADALRNSVIDPQIEFWENKRELSFSVQPKKEIL